MPVVKQPAFSASVRPEASLRDPGMSLRCVTTNASTTP
jgi:hypothetical protein